jgi:hypothetical protein
MRTFLVLICSLALASVAGGAQEENKSTRAAPKKKQTQSAQPQPPKLSAQPTASPSRGAVKPRYRLHRHAGKARPPLYPDLTLAPPKDSGAHKPTGAGKATTVGKPKTQTERELMDLLSESRRNLPAGADVTQTGILATPVGTTEAGKPAKADTPTTGGKTITTAVGKPTTVDKAAGKPAANAQIDTTQARELAISEQRGASTGPGKFGGGKKKAAKVSPTPRPR